MTYRVGWGGGAGSAVVDTPGELDKVLDGITVERDDLPYCVSISVAADDSLIPVMLQICVGHRDRSFVFHVAGDDSAAWGYEPDVEEGGDFVFDYGGVATDTWPERTRVTVSAAREAAREFVTKSGERPTNLRWDE